MIRCTPLMRHFLPYVLLAGILCAVQVDAAVILATNKGRRGAVVSEVEECSEAGLDMLKLGGSAADAIIATSLCVGTISAYHCGIGGGGFALVRSQSTSGKSLYEMIDFRDTMPALGNETMYLNSTIPNISTFGGLAIGVPGEMRGWELLHKRHGRLPWKDLFQPAIKLARDGFVVNNDMVDRLNPTIALALFPFLVNDPLFAESYSPKGKILTAGQKCYKKRLAKTLTTLADEGADAFYHGSIAKNTAAAAVNRGGILTTEDLGGYQALLRTPANITYRNKYRIFSTIAPSSGSAVLSALKIFEGFDGSALPDDPAINLTTHRLIQATKFAYGQRTNYGDPAFTKNVTELEALFLQPEAVENARKKILDTSTFPAIYYNPPNYHVLNDSGTSHMAAVDKWGNVISLTTSINLFWGSHVMSEDGIILNDVMDDFSSPGQKNAYGFEASPANYIRPGKRPQSSIAPAIVEDLKTGAFVMATGSAGGAHIITATVQHLYNHLDQGLSAFESAYQSRWHDQLGPFTLFELPYPKSGLDGFNNGTVGFLRGLGYNVSYFAAVDSYSHIITVKKDGTFDAMSEPRQSASGGLVY